MITSSTDSLYVWKVSVSPDHTHGHTHTNTHTQSAGFPWESDRPVAGTFTCTIHNVDKRETAMSAARLKTAIPEASGHRHMN